MGAYISTREKIAKDDKGLIEFLSISGYRYETLKNTLDYMKQIWKMTKDYVQSAQKLFDGLKRDVSNKSLNSLTLVTSMTAGSSIITVLTKEPVFTAFGLSFAIVLAIVVFSTNKFLNYISKNRQYKISDEEYDKEIIKR